MEYVWLCIVIILILIEACTADLTTIWFIASGIVSLFLSIYMDNLFLEVAIFSLGGILLLITTKPLLRKYMKPKKVALNLDRILEMRGVALEDIDSTNGEVKVDGKVWRAFSDEKIKKGEFVRILEIQSTKLKVKKEEE